VFSHFLNCQFNEVGFSVGVKALLPQLTEGTMGLVGLVPCLMLLLLATGHCDDAADSSSLATKDGQEREAVSAADSAPEEHGDHR
jgi:hypothetical protein